MHSFHKFILAKRMKLYMFRAVPLPIIRSSFTVHLALVYVIQVWRQLSNRAGIYPGPARKLSSNLYDIYQCQVYGEWTPDDGQRNCPKHVELHSFSQNKFVKLVHLLVLL